MSKKSQNEKNDQKNNKKMSSPKIEKFDTKILNIKYPPKFAKYENRANLLVPEQVNFELLNVNLGIANGIRRTIMSEILVRSLHFERADFESTDPFHIIDMIEQRINIIPILQNTSPDAVFSLSITNNSKYEIEVRSQDIKIVSGCKKLPFNNFVLCTLQAGKTISISKIKIREGYGYNNSGAFSVAFLTACTPLDETPYTIFNNKSIGGTVDVSTGANTGANTGAKTNINTGTSQLINNTNSVQSSMSNPRHHLIKFTTNGTLDTKLIVERALTSLVSRLEKTREDIEEFSKNNILHKNINNEQQFIINNENDTIGNIIARTIYDISEDAIFAYQCHPNLRQVTLRIRANNAEAAIYESIDTAIDVINQLLKSL